MQVQRNVCKDNAEVERRINFALLTSDDIAITAGEYFYFTKAFLISFFGVVATYFIVLCQSI